MAPLGLSGITITSLFFDRPVNMESSAILNVSLLGRRILGGHLLGALARRSLPRSFSQRAYTSDSKAPCMAF